MYAAAYVEPAGAADTRRATSTVLTPYALAYVEPYGGPYSLNAARGTRHLLWSAETDSPSLWSGPCGRPGVGRHKVASRRWCWQDNQSKAS